MKSRFFVASMIAALLALPATAQQGPAGIPGVFGLVESVLPTPTPARVRDPIPKQENCSKAKDTEQCKTRQETRKTALKACSGKTGKARTQCLKQQTRYESCKKSPDPARCLQFQKTYDLCQNKLGQAHRQCLFDNLVSKP